ncbi:MAG TPA: hypothetical protein VHM31_03580 [Polyangia bacterium]|nr:hypothetical protein [Polyangia bacterium]HVY36981.1 hypothetical protein [Polyangia bacterium]
MLVVVASQPAWGWGSAEHQEIGRAAYWRACTDLAGEISDKGPPGARTRFEIACGSNVQALADTYGDATAIAGDFLSEPSEFLSQAGAWRFSSKKSYLLLALENSAHFNPMAIGSWAEYHDKAIAEALAGAHSEGLAVVAAYQLAIQESAFADHFLQDSFAAGHMGFNRTASSAAAAKSFHDSWNVRGRVVSDRNGDRWVTFGDGRLDRPENADGRRHVMDAAAASVHGVLRVFVFGERRSEDELAIWRALPFAIQAPDVKVNVVEIFERTKDPADRELVPLLATVRPARKDLVLSAGVWSVAPFRDAHQDLVAAVAAIELAVPRVPEQMILGAGGTLREPGGGHSALLQTGILFPVGLSVRSFVSHQLNVSAAWVIDGRLDVVLHGEYQANAELGDLLLSVQVGLAELLPAPRTGWYGGVGIAYALTAAGGGAF